MNLLRKWARYAALRVGSMSRRARLAAAALAVLVLAGIVWLVAASSGPEMVPVLTQPLGPEEVAAAGRLLSQRGIAHRQESDRLLVPRSSLQEARALLASEHLPQLDASSALEQVARENDIWCSQAQSDKRWQAAKMATLGRLISMFPSVQSATVIFDAGSPRRLGNGGEPPSAAVKVTLRPNAKMTEKLVAAIADLVAGSTAGMSRQNVRIVDSAGMSYRVSEPGAAGGELDRLRATEAYYLERIGAALQYIDGVIVTAQVSPDPGSGKCVGASVSVPRSYLAAVYRLSRGGAPSGDEEMQAFAAPHLAKIRETVARAIGADAPEAVKADWYYDVSAEPADRSQAAPPGRTGLSGWVLAFVISAGAAATGAAGWLLRRRAVRRRRMSAGAEPARKPALAGRGIPGTDSSGAGEGDSSRFFAFLQGVSSKDLLDALRAEHPQTIAMVLSHLSEHKAGEILAGLPAPRQVEIAHRIAGLERIDPEVASEVERTLAARLAGAPAGERGAPGGVATVARILQRAGHATERAVLEGLAPSEPALADSIRRQLFAFEDIAQMPSARLGAALEHLDADELAVALRTSGDQIKQKVLSCLRPTQARRLRDQMESIGPVRLSDVEAAQQSVVEVVRRQEDGRYAPVGKVGQDGLLA